MLSIYIFHILYYCFCCPIPEPSPCEPPQMKPES